MKRQERHKKSHDTLALCNRAAALLKGCGFELRTISSKTEACYYALPGRKSLIRVATHKFGGPRQLNRANVVAKLTFNGGIGDSPGQMRLAEMKFEAMVAVAIGKYMLESAKETSHER